MGRQGGGGGGVGAAPPPPQDGGGGGIAPGRPVQAPPIRLQEAPTDRGLSGGYSQFAQGADSSGSNSSNSNPLQPPVKPPVDPSDPTPVDPPYIPPIEPPEVPPVIPSANIPQLLLVLVRTESAAGSRSLEGNAISESIASQHGAVNSSIDMRKQYIPRFQLQGEILVPGSAFSSLEDADLSVIANDVGFVDSTILGGTADDVVIINAEDLLSLVMGTPKTATANVKALSGAAENSEFSLGDGANTLDLKALQRLSFTAVGPLQPEKARLTFDLLTNAIKNCLISMGAGSDILLINSGWNGGELAQDVPLLLEVPDVGISLTLDPMANLAGQPANFSASLNALAVGMEGTSVDLGDGNNYMSINTVIDENLSSDLGLFADLPSTTYKLDRIGLLNSQITMGAGDDTLIINGRIVDSTIDLGKGNNKILLETAPEGTSQILSAGGNNQIVVSKMVGGTVTGGAGDDTLQLTAIDAFGFFDGGGGNNTVLGPTGGSANRDVISIIGEDRGFYNAIRFENVGTVDTGDKNDVVIMAFGASLSGKLLGGAGLDRLEFQNWTLPVTVDLDLGISTGIGSENPGSIAGFERVKGGNGDDLLISSGAFSGIEGGAGDDLMYLRWTPWLSAPSAGLQVTGGDGKDLFVFSGLDTPAPSSWDGKSGLPVLTDFNLSYASGEGIGISDRLGIVVSTVNPDGSKSQSIEVLTAAGLSGLGNAKLLPIAPLDQLVSGMTDNTKQLAIGIDPLSKSAPSLVLLGVNGKGSYENIAKIQNNSFLVSSLD